MDGNGRKQDRAGGVAGCHANLVDPLAAQQKLGAQLAHWRAIWGVGMVSPVSLLCSVIDLKLLRQETALGYHYLAQSLARGHPTNVTSAGKMKQTDLKN